jgi:hypothetical protein
MNNVIKLVKYTIIIDNITKVTINDLNLKDFKN